MRHGPLDIGHSKEIRKIQTNGRDSRPDDFVLEKSIFNNVFEKDIRRVFIYRKAERLAKAIHLVTPAFAESMSLKNRIDAIAIGLIDAAILPLNAARGALSRELLALSSVLSIAHTSGLLSFMNAELISHEAHNLLQEVATYEEPRLFLEEAPTLSDIAKKARSLGALQQTPPVVSPKQNKQNHPGTDKGQIKDISDIHIKDRQATIMSVIRNKGNSSIKDISTLIRDVSEKTIQRELLALIASGRVIKRGERRWSTYSLS